MKTQLHKTQQGFIVTSDEKPLNLGFDTLRGCLWDIEQNSMNGDIYKRVIAQQHQLDFSAISEEKCKEIGWFDEVEIYRLANEAMEGGKDLPKGLVEYRGKAVDFAFDKYVQGMKKMKELLSDRVFTLEDVKNAVKAGIKIGNQSSVIYQKKLFDEHIQSLTPTTWEITGEFVEDKYRITEIK